MKLNNTIIWIFLSIIGVALFLFYVSYPNLRWGGDSIEYYGITESFKNHASPNLTLQDKENIEKLLNPVYFTMPGWYIPGKDGQRYPVHFIVYSLLALPVRLVLEFLRLHPFDALRITNVILFLIGAVVIVKYFLTSSFQKWAFLLVLFFSPLVWFLIWPGPEMYYSMLLLIAVFCFYRNHYLATSMLVTLASWHSQPLLILALGSIVYLLSTTVTTHKTIEEQRMRIHLPLVGAVFLLLFLLTIPYIYNYLVFGVFSPWTLLQDSWTLMYGFGIHNVSVRRLFEQFFDLNIGLFWYAPLLVLGGLWFMKRQYNKEAGRFFTRKTFWVGVGIVVTAFFYQTNPAWHYGTAGFGPTRHALYVLPFLLFFITKEMSLQIKHAALLLLVIATQLYVLSFNWFLTPNFMNVLSHSPYAQYMLDNHPDMYNPTPEIFVDRTNHIDDALRFAVYKKNGVCKKAYALLTDAETLKKECGFIPKAYEAKLSNPLVKKVEYPRAVKTPEATLWADPTSCATPLETPKYICMHTISEVMEYTGVKDAKRFQKIEPYTGAWKLTWGKPVTLAIPPGYFTNYYALEGIYVNY